MTKAQQDAAQRRAAFLPSAQDMARKHGWPTHPLAGVGRIPRWASWYADESTVVAVVADGEPWQNVDKALAFGLDYSGERRLVLALPTELANPTRVRTALLSAPVELFAHIGGQAEALRELTTLQAYDFVRERTGLRHATHQLGDREAWVSDLLVDLKNDRYLVDAHRSNYCSWHAYGMMLLKITRSKSGLRVTAGIHYSGAGQRPELIELREPITSKQCTVIKRAIKAGIEVAKYRVAGAYHEHLMQANMLRQKRHLDWSESDLVLREFPARRASGRAAYIDFLRIERSGQSHIVETKVGHGDEMLVLQGLDYWIWAQANAKNLERELHMNPRRASVDYMVAGKPGGSDWVVSPRIVSHLRHLPSDMEWRFHRVTNFTGGRIAVESLRAGEAPGVEWHGRFSKR